MHAASLGGDLETVKLLLQAQTDLTAREPKTGNSPLHFSAVSDNGDILATLVNACADVDALNASGRTAVHMAANCGNLGCLALLVKAQADIDLVGSSTSSRTQDTESVMYQAAGQGLLEAVKLLMSASAQINSRVLCSDGFSSPLHVAAEHGNWAVVSALIDGPARMDVNLRDANGATPLFIASKFGYDGVVRILVRALADVNKTNRHGGTPLYIACQNGHAKVVEELLDAQANVDMRSVFGAGPIHIAAQNGYTQIVDSLLAKGGANPNSLGQGGTTAIRLAAHMGHRKIVERLIEAKANVNLMDVSSITPLTAATCHCHLDIVSLLVDHGARINLESDRDLSIINILYIARAFAPAFTLVQRALENCNSGSMLVSLVEKLSINLLNFKNVNLISDTKVTAEGRQLEAVKPKAKITSGIAELSFALHSALNLAGFTRSRATLQSSVADVLQDILRRKCRDDGLCVVGSFSEGWGNSVSQLNGRTDPESDIDVTQLLEGRLYHIRGMCNCIGIEDSEQANYHNGHIACVGFASTPARPEIGTTLRPAIDRVDACRLCCYPPIGPLSAERRSRSHMPGWVLQALEQETTTSPCHVVNAAPPGEAGNHLRVSTTFLEKRLLRSLNTIQGQLFITLKYLVKKVISRRVHGVKAYHAKTLTFRMVEDTPADQWQPNNLVILIRQALRILLASVENMSNNPDGRVMDHFFLSDAALYLKGDDRSDTKQIAEVLRDIIEHLNPLLQKFIEQLEPVESTGRFYFHPFLITPVVDPHPVTEADTLKYHDIYDVVRDALIRLSDEDQRSELESLIKSIDRLPDCAKTTRECLKAMVYLKLGEKRREDAVKIVKDCASHAVCRGIDWCSTETKNTSTPDQDFVFRFLTENDTAWRFCFRIYIRPQLKFLPGSLAECFPGVLENYMECMYMNFDALLKCLCFELLPADCDHLAQSKIWFEGAGQRLDSDSQDKLMALHYCPDYEWRGQLIWKFTLEVSRDSGMINKTQEVLMEINNLRRKRMISQLSAVLEENRHKLTEEQIAFFEKQILDQYSLCG